MKLFNALQDKHKGLLFFIVLSVIGIIAGILLVQSPLDPRNRAQTPSTAYVCSFSYDAKGAMIKSIVVEFTNEAGVVLETKSVLPGELPDPQSGTHSLIFNYTPDGSTYSCSATIYTYVPSPSAACPGAEASASDSDSIACEAGPTLTPPDEPTLTPPSDVDPFCETCIDGSFVCTEKPDLRQSGKSCPSLSVHNITYTNPDNSACPSQPLPAGLDCTKDTVVIEASDGTKRELLEKECEDVKAGTFDIRIHTAKENESCETYDLYAITDTGEELPVCETCDFKAGCPTACYQPTDLAINQLIDIPDLQPSGKACTPGVCELTIIGGACGKPGTVLQLEAYLQNGGRIYWDDQFGQGGEWENLAPGDHVLRYAYNESGYFDVVLECEQTPAGGGDPEYYQCAHRITRTCASDGGPPVSPEPTGSCREINVQATCQ